MRIGVDLDNTIICYDPVFRSAALARGLISPHFAGGKSQIKDHLQATRGDAVWTSLQADVYGPLIGEATAFPGVAAFFGHARTSGDELFIISHKTQFPARGPKIDLRVSAQRWLETHGWFSGTISMSRENVEFHASRQEKIAAIARHRIDVFIDDLPEVFSDPEFPSTTTAILFDPQGSQTASSRTRCATAWQTIEDWLLAAQTP